MLGDVVPPRDHAIKKTSNLKEPGKITEECKKSSHEGGSDTHMMTDANVNLVVTKVVCVVTLVDDVSKTEATTVVTKFGIGEASGPGTNKTHDMLLEVNNDLVRIVTNPVAD